MRYIVHCFVLAGMFAGCNGIVDDTNANAGVASGAKPSPTSTVSAIQAAPRLSPEDQVRRHLEMVRDEGSTDKDHYASIALLRQSPQQAVAALRKSFAALPETSTLRRWDIADTLGLLVVDEAAPALSEIVKMPAPSLQNTAESRENDVMVRSRALSGLGLLAAHGNREAISTLKESMRHADPQMRYAAVQGYLTWKNTPERTSEVNTILPEADNWMMKVGRSAAALHNPQLTESERKRFTTAIEVPPRSAEGTP